MRKELDKQLDTMQKAGIISTSDNSVRASPVIMVKNRLESGDSVQKRED